MRSHPPPPCCKTVLSVERQALNTTILERRDSSICIVTLMPHRGPRRNTNDNKSLYRQRRPPFLLSAGAICVINTVLDMSGEMSCRYNSGGNEGGKRDYEVWGDEVECSVPSLYLQGMSKAWCLLDLKY